MISPEQCKAARALLGWKQEDLVEKSSVSRGAIRDFETGNRTPQKSTMVVIIQAFESEDIEFTSGNGVRFKN